MKMMRVILLLGTIVVCVFPCLCQSTDCNKAVLEAIMQLRTQLDDLVLFQSCMLDLQHNRMLYKKINSRRLYKFCKLRKCKRKYGSLCGKMNHEKKKKIFIPVETFSTFRPTTIDYVTETMETTISIDTGNLTTEFSGGFTDNPTTLSNLR